MRSNKTQNFFSNFVGSFSDAAILFPLLILMGQKTSFQFPLLFLSAGLLVVLSGVYFRIPMSVQPLKSIAIAAVAVGATAAEIQLSTLLLSLIFFIVLFTQKDKWLSYFPESWIHALQVALGVLLLRQGYTSVSPEANDLYVLIIFSGLLVLLIKLWQWPFLGVLATVALAYAFISGVQWSDTHMQNIDFSFGFAMTDVRWSLVLNLLLPQLLLTTANSVIATEYVCKKYYSHQPEVSRYVTKTRLIKSIAVTNLFSGLFGGLPMCHGSGGVTALYKGGAKHWTSNLYLGFFLLILAIISYFFDVRAITFPKLIFATLLVVVGIYHLLLARTTWLSLEGKIRLLVSVFAVLWTRNLIVVLLAQILISIIKHWLSLKLKKQEA